MRSKILKSLLSFQDGDIRDSFSDSILYGLLVKLSENSEVSRESAKDVIGEKFYSKFAGEKGSL